MEMPHHNPGDGQKLEAVNHINMLITQLGQYGGNGSEIPDMHRIIAKLEKGDIDPDVAIADADEIFHSKNGMHDMYR